MRTHRLVLKKEVLTELCGEDLASVVGGTTKTTTAVASTAVGCLSDQIQQCDSWLRPCISNTCTR